MVNLLPATTEHSVCQSQGRYQDLCVWRAVFSVQCFVPLLYCLHGILCRITSNKDLLSTCRGQWVNTQWDLLPYPILFSITLDQIVVTKTYPHGACECDLIGNGV